MIDADFDDDDRDVANELRRYDETSEWLQEWLDELFG